MLVKGLLIGPMSGSLAGVTASHNKGGQYLRLRAIPTISTTAPALAAKAFLGEGSAAFGGLTQAERDSWDRYGTLRPEVNALGDPKILSGIASHNRIFTRMRQAGDTPRTAPPIGTDPNAVATLSATFDIGVGTTELTFTPTPLAATERLWLQAAVVDSQGINFIESVKRLVTVAVAATASPFDYLSVVEAIFGTLIVGQKVILLPRVYDDATGLVSLPRRVDGVVVSTV